MINQALEEHHIVTGLINELASQDLDEEHFEAKFKVLAEAVRHYVEEEESEMFPLVEGD